MPRVVPVSIGGANRARSVLTPPKVNGAGAVVRGLSQLREDIERQNRHRDALHADEKEAEYNRRVAKRLAELDPLENDYTRKVEQAHDEVRRDVMEEAEFSTGEVRDSFASQLRVLQANSVTGAIVDRDTALAEQAGRRYDEAAERTLAQIRQDPDSRKVIEGSFNLDAQRLVPSMTRAQVETKSLAFAEDAAVAQVEGLALQGRFDEARETADQVQEILPPETFRFLKGRITQIENEAANQRNAASAARVADLRVQIEDAQSVMELDKIRSTMENERKIGLFEGRQNKFASMVARLNTRRRQMADDQELRATVNAKLASGTGVNSQKEADVGWAMRREHLGENASVQTQLDHLQEYVEDSGWVPTEFKRLVSNAERSNDPNLLATGAAVYDSVREVAPETVNTGAAERGSRVRLVSSAVELGGISYDDAARLVADKTPQDIKQQRERESDGFDAEFSEFDPREILRDNDAVPESSIFGLFGEDVRITEGAANDFERMMRFHYGQSGDPELAKRASLKRFAEVYGPTSVGGERRVVRFPPERFFPGATNGLLSRDEKRTILDEMIRRQLDELGVAPAVVVGDEGGEDQSGLPPFRLQATAETPKDVASGRPPRYRVLVRNAAGSYSAVPLRRADGTRDVLTVRVPNIDQLQQSPEYQAILQEAEREFLRERAARRRRRIPEVVLPSRPTDPRPPFEAPPPEGTRESIAAQPPRGTPREPTPEQSREAEETFLGGS